MVAKVLFHRSRSIKQAGDREGAMADLKLALSVGSGDAVGEGLTWDY
jgi:hypothetical protein